MTSTENSDREIVSDLSDTKACPACAETIKAAAIKCRYCGENLEVRSGPSTTQTVAKPYDHLNTVLGFSGAMAILVGPFAPYVSIPIVGAITFFNSLEGKLIFGLGLISLILVILRYPRGLRLTGPLSLAIFLWNALPLAWELSKAQRDSMDTAKNGNFGDQLAAVTLQSIQLQWGAVLLLIGPILLIIAAWYGSSTAEFSQFPSAKSIADQPVRHVFPKWENLLGLLGLILLAACAMFAAGITIVQTRYNDHEKLTYLDAVDGHLSLYREILIANPGSLEEIRDLDTEATADSFNEFKRVYQGTAVDNDFGFLTRFVKINEATPAYMLALEARITREISPATGEPVPGSEDKKTAIFTQAQETFRKLIDESLQAAKEARS